MSVQRAFQSYAFHVCVPFAVYAFGTPGFFFHFLCFFYKIELILVKFLRDSYEIFAF